MRKGNCVRQSETGATALLGPIFTPTITALTSTPAATSSGAWRPMTTIFKPSHEQMVSSWFGNRTLQEIGVPTMRIGTLDSTQTAHWFTIASRLISPGGNDFVGASVIMSMTRTSRFGEGGGSTNRVGSTR